MSTRLAATREAVEARAKVDLDDLSFVGQLGFVALGVVASALIPVLVAAWPKGGGRRTWTDVWKFAKPYLALAAGSLLIGLVVLAILASQDKSLKVWWQALLAGYAFDSTLQKFKDGQGNRSRY